MASDAAPEIGSTAPAERIPAAYPNEAPPPTNTTPEPFASGADHATLPGRSKVTLSHRDERMKIADMLRCVAATWIAVIATALTGFFLTPLILHKLGDEAYGLWVLTVAITDYYLFLRVGLRSAVVRYVSRFLALGDLESVNRYLVSGFYFYSAVGVLIIGLTLALVPKLPSYFGVHSQFRHAVTALFMLAGLAQALDFLLNIFEGGLESVGRFDMLYGARVGALVLRVVLILYILHHGGGLFAVGATTILCSLCLRCTAIPFLFHQIPGLSLHPRWAEWKALKEMIKYGVVTFFVELGQKLRISVYPLVIAKLISAVAVTMMALPMRLLAFPMEGATAMTEFVNPLSSQIEAHQDFARLRRVLVMSAQACVLVLAPMAAVLLLLGKQILTFWVGKQYSGAYSILVLLTIGWSADALQASTQAMLFGLGRHKGLIFYRTLEGVLIAILGIGFTKLWGVWGCALGMAIPLVIVNLFLLPRHICKMIDLPISIYVRDGVLRTAGLTIPTIVGLLLMRPLFDISVWTGLIPFVLIGGAIYVLTLVAAVYFGGSRVAWIHLGILDIVANHLLSRRRTSRFLAVIYGAVVQAPVTSSKT